MNIFDKVGVKKVKSSKFNLNHDVKLSFDMGELVPTCVIDTIPGDVFEINHESMLRFAPLVAPVMHKVNVFTHYFFVPNRILWAHWEDWISKDPSTVEHPYIINGSTLVEGTIADYLGYNPTTNDDTYEISPMAIAAYLKIYDDWYRDENLQAEKFQPLASGRNAPYEALAVLEPLKRAWMRDYFTACLPWSQKGAAVTLPLTDTNPEVQVSLTGGGQPRWLNTITGQTQDGLIRGAASSLKGDVTADPGTGEQDVTYDPQGTLLVDVNDQAVTLTTLRRAEALQKWLELNARGGTRYNELIDSHFDTNIGDARLQRPELIGMSKQRMVISEVLSTAQTDPTGTQEIPIGQMAGHGISVGGSKTWKYKAREHGFIIGITNVQPVTAYQQGLPRMYQRFDKLDYPWPLLAHIGEQAVKNSELYAQAASKTELDDTFGYIPRYSEMKYVPSRVAGEFKSSLQYWSLVREFTSLPALNSDFIECNPSKRIFAVEDPDSDTIYAHVFNNITAYRKLPKYSIPHM